MIELPERRTIKCPGCGRSRVIRSGTTLAYWASQGKLEPWMGRCVSCKLAASIGRHERALAKLRVQLRRRRMRGL